MKYGIEKQDLIERKRKQATKEKNGTQKEKGKNGGMETERNRGKEFYPPLRCVEGHGEGDVCGKRKGGKAKKRRRRR